MKKTQLLKGVLEGCVLLTLNNGEQYGYELVIHLREAGFTDITGGTVYPLLQKLEKNKLTSSVKKPSPSGPNRKYYSLTDSGKKQCERFEKEWLKLEKNVDQIIAQYQTKERKS